MNRILPWRRSSLESDAAQRPDPGASITATSELDHPDHTPVKCPVQNSAPNFRGSSGNLRLILSYAFRFWRLMLPAGGLGLAAAMLAPLAAFFFAAAVQTFFQVAAPEPAATEPDSSPFGISIGAIAEQLVQWMSQLGGGGEIRLLIILVLGFVIVSLLYQGTMFAVRWLSFLLQAKTYYSLQRSLYENILRQPLHFFHRERVGDLISRLNNDVMAATRPAAEVLQSVTARILTLIFLILLMAQTNAWVTLMVFSIGASASLIPMIIGRRYRSYSRQQQYQQSDVISGIQEALYASRLVKSIATEDREVEKYWQRAMRMFNIQKRISLYQLFVERSSLVTALMALAALLILGGSLIRSGAISMAEYVTFIYVAREAGVLVSELIRTVMQVFSVQGASDRVVELLQVQPSLRDGSEAKTEFLEAIELKSVSFDYGNRPVLENINLTIRRGEFVALVGPSGCGKSTLLDLILRLDDPKSGQVLMDGEDVRRFTQKSYRRLFGVVSQETILFNDTVLNNITYGTDAVSEEQVEFAAGAANAQSFIDLLPKKGETTIGDRGLRISGGERQRLAIARALVSDPQILVFDEATSSLDSHSERQVQQAIDPLVGTRTAVVVAHRLSTITNADRIYVMDRGRIIEEGTHQELRGQGGLYTSLLRLQEASGEMDSPLIRAAEDDLSENIIRSGG